MASKSQLRKEFLARRRALLRQEVERQSLVIVERFFRDDILFRKMSSLSIDIFLPIRHQNEVNTWPLIHRIWSEHPEIQLSAPVAHTDTHTLTHYPLTPETTLVENRWGIPEPLLTTVCLMPADFDLVLVPLLIFDQNGHRVGYGGGYYDRFLAECRPNCLKIGLSLFDPVEKIDDVEGTDIRLDVCLTPSQIHRFSQ